MVAPIYLIAVPLAVAFLSGFLRKSNTAIPSLLFMATLLFLAIVPGTWLWSFWTQQAEAQQIFTAGFEPPVSINLQFGMAEAVFVMLINSAALLAGYYLYREIREKGISMQIVFLLLIVGLDVVVMTRDLFNLFVFFEIGTIAMAGLIMLSKTHLNAQAGLKYLIATAVISGLLLIGVAVIYAYGRSLNIDVLSQNITGIAKGGVIGLFFILMAIILELKPFPANGWALDVYQAAPAGIGGLLSAAPATASLFVLYKLMPLENTYWAHIIAILGIITFVGSNLLALRQDNSKRLLGYSSIAQIGLVMTVLGLVPVLQEKTLRVGLAILVTHFLAKQGLFWLRGMIDSDRLEDWSVLRSKPMLVFYFGVFVFALTGFPPFPSFFGKWELITALAEQGQTAYIVAILLGSFLEVVYLFRWLGFAIKKDINTDVKITFPFNKHLPVSIVGAALFVYGYWFSSYGPENLHLNMIPLLFVAIIFLVDFLPARIKNILAIAGLGYYAWMQVMTFYEDDKLRFIFSIIFLVGGVLTFIPGFSKKGARKGFYPAALIMYAGLAMLLEATSFFSFFVAWEIMTIGSYLLLIRGKRSMPHALNYMLFSVGGAYLLFAGFAFAQAGQIGGSLHLLSSVKMMPMLTYTLLAVGFLTKTAALGVHIWLPGAHAEAESDVSPMVSAILLKAGIFGLLLLFIAMGAELTGNHPLMYALGWLGAITALIGNLAASFQEDAKRLLAYSSIGQLGYVLFAYSIMTHLGWLTGMTYTINHAAFKALLFLAIGGVVLRTKTHNMYEMGGLIKLMPFSFIAVLIGIITLSGVPPLSGFAGKWLFYNAVIAKGWYFQGAIVFFAGIIAFLYCFRLIYSVFLGQLKDNHRKVKEAPIWFIIPQYILIIGIMVFSARPQWVLEPIGNMLTQWFPSGTLSWSADGMANSPLGYWNGAHVMIIVGVMFVLLLGWLYANSRKAQKVGQFDIVYAAERPERPETTHLAYNMFGGYNKAMGWLVAPKITQFWYGISNLFHDIAEYTRRWYTGNGQTYVLHILAYVIVVYLISNGGF